MNLTRQDSQENYYISFKHSDGTADFAELVTYKAFYQRQPKVSVLKLHDSSVAFSVLRRKLQRSACKTIQHSVLCLCTNSFSERSIQHFWTVSTFCESTFSKIFFFLVCHFRMLLTVNSFHTSILHSRFIRFTTFMPQSISKIIYMSLITESKFVLPFSLLRIFPFRFMNWMAARRPQIIDMDVKVSYDTSREIQFLERLVRNGNCEEFMIYFTLVTDDVRFSLNITNGFCKYISQL